MSAPSQIGPYRIVREIARGGMGAVYEAAADGDPRRLALKVISFSEVSPEDLARFGREAELMAQVQHPNLIGIHTLDRTPQGLPYLVCDLIEGKTLTELTKKGGVPPEDAARILAQLCHGLEAMHAAGILHRDLKPDNVMVQPDGTPVLLDFGIARELDNKTLTQSGALLGTPGFMAPEQAEGRSFRELDARTDVYGLGAILYYLLSGHAPFEGPSITNVLFATIQKEVDFSKAAGAPAALVDVTRRCLRKEAGDRYATAAELREDLERFLRGEAIEGGASSWRGPLLFGAASLLVLLLVVALLITYVQWRYTRGGGGPETPPPVVPDPAGEGPPKPAPDPPAGAYQLLEGLHPPRETTDASCRVAFTDDDQALLTCGHSSKIGILGRLDAADWELVRTVTMRSPGVHVAFQPNWGKTPRTDYVLSWSELGDYQRLELRGQDQPEDLELRILDPKVVLPDVDDPLRYLESLRGRPLSCLYKRGTLDTVFLCLRSDPPASEPLHAFRVDWDGERNVRQYRDDRTLRGGPANVRAMTNLATRATAAVGDAVGEVPPMRVWFVGENMSAGDSWPPNETQVPMARALSVVGMTPGKRRVFLWGDQDGFLHQLTYPEQAQPDDERTVRDPVFSPEVHRLPGPVTGLAWIWHPGAKRLLIFAVTGHAHDPARWTAPPSNQLTVLAWHPNAPLETVATRPLRPMAYAWVRVSVDTKTLLLTRADCQVETWSVDALLGG